MRSGSRVNAYLVFTDHTAESWRGDPGEVYYAGRAPEDFNISTILSLACTGNDGVPFFSGLALDRRLFGPDDDRVSRQDGWSKGARRFRISWLCLTEMPINYSDSTHI